MKEKSAIIAEICEGGTARYYEDTQAFMEWLDIEEEEREKVEKFVESYLLARNAFDKKFLEKEEK